MPASLRRHLAARRQELVSQSEALRQQLSDDAASLRHRVDVVKRLLTLIPVVRPLIARLWRRRR
ncbi:MAG: hypothetical protein ACHQIL_14090 [Steroidobacterales bacterium]